MYIIDKNKDYYDYLSGIYGIDKIITYDRRGSIVLTEYTLLNQISHYDHSYQKSLKETEHFILEIGNKQYLFKTEIKYVEQDQSIIPIEGIYSLIKIFDDHKHYYEKEISLVPCKVQKHWKYYSHRQSNDKFEAINNYNDIIISQESKSRLIANPILTNTIIPSFIPAKDIWIELSNFISSKYNDKTVLIINTDTDKIINHGFNTRTSFRNPIKL
jgi:hypothetical protein